MTTKSKAHKIPRGILGLISSSGGPRDKGGTHWAAGCFCEYEEDSLFLLALPLLTVSDARMEQDGSKRMLHPACDWECRRDSSQSTPSPLPCYLATPQLPEQSLEECFWYQCRTVEAVSTCLAANPQWLQIGLEDTKKKRV